MPFPAGWYYVGDISYMDETDGISWSGLLKVTKYKDGIFKTDGRPFAIYSTMHGDGSYKSKRGLTFPVDSGTIGCIKLKNVAEAKSSYPVRGVFKLGHVIRFIKPFATSSSNGFIRIGNIRIDTRGNDELEPAVVTKPKRPTKSRPKLIAKPIKTKPKKTTTTRPIKTKPKNTTTKKTTTKKTTTKKTTTKKTKV